VNVGARVAEDLIINARVAEDVNVGARVTEDLNGAMIIRATGECVCECGCTNGQ
jgi:hypothetical protein